VFGLYGKMGTQPALWIRPPDRIPFTLVENYYTSPLNYYEGWSLITKTKRVGLYRNGNQYIVVCKGTTPTNAEDLLDDARIGLLLSGELSLEHEVRKIVKRIPVTAEKVTVTGHSLGGRVALSVAKDYNYQAVVFNPAAPFTSPLDKGPGPKNAVSYHINGDLISSNVDPDAAEVIRIDQGYTPFDMLKAHSMATFDSNVPTYGFKSVDQEDVYIASALVLAIWATNDQESFQKTRAILTKISTTPIPKSLRDLEKKNDSQTLMVGENFVHFIGRLDSLDSDVRIVQSALGHKVTGFLPQKAKTITAIGKMVNLTEDIGANMIRIADHIRNLRLIPAGINYQILQGQVDELNHIYKELRGSPSNHKVSDVLLESRSRASVVSTDTTYFTPRSSQVDTPYFTPRSSQVDTLRRSSVSSLSPSEIYEKADLQMIGIEDEHLAKLEFSPKTPDPEKYLLEVSEKKSFGSTQSLNELHNTNLSKLSKQGPRPVFEFNPFSKAKNTIKTVYKDTFTGLKTSGTKSVAKSLFEKVAKIASKTVTTAGRAVAKTLQVLVPVLAAADLAYTTYLLVKGIYTGNYNEIVEWVTGTDLETWKENVELVKKGPTEYWRPYMESIRPSCERCPPGGPLMWDGTTCVPNKCGKVNGVWGVFNKQLGTCNYGVRPRIADLAHPGWDIPTQGRPDANQSAEQQQAMNDFKAKETEYRKYTETNGWWDITAGTKASYKQSYAWDNLCPK